MKIETGGKDSYRSRIDAAVLGAGHDEALAAHEETFSKGLILGGTVAGHDGGDELHLLGLELHLQC